ncbi:MAG: acyltransferase family protein [Ruminococcus flavefaciens]|nr:acyltransferase family protein [Ruminococcus flavefaciens]
MMQNKTFAGIDYFRLVAAFMVIAIHISPLSVCSGDIDYLITYCIGRIAVPFFFMTTGYFVLAPYVFSNFKKKYLLHNYLVKNIRLYLFVTVIYLPVSVYSGNIPHNLFELMKQLLFDGTFYHLWYFPAAIIGCILLACLAKKSIQAAIGFSVIAYVIGIFGDSYYGIIENVPLLHRVYNGVFYVSSYTRNGIFFAPIFILLGMILAVFRFHCRENTCKCWLVLSLLLMLLEGFITYKLNLQKHNSMYLFLLPVMYFLFQLLLNVSGKSPVWIRSVSMMLYIIHPAVIIALRAIAKVTGLTKILVENTLIQYISVCVLSLTASFCIQAFWERGIRYVSKRKGMD